MPVPLVIVERGQYLEMRSSRPRRWLRAAINASAFVVVFYLVLHRYLTPLVLYLLAALGALLSAFSELQVQTVTLRISKFEAQVIGTFGGGYTPNRHVPVANIQGFEYRCERGGGNLGGYQPEGLYAELEYGSSRILPNIDEEQTALTIETIYERFPQLPFSTIQSHSLLFKEDRMSLNLDKK